MATAKHIVNYVKKIDTVASARKALGSLLHNGAKTATVYVRDNLVVRVTRRTYRNAHRGHAPIELAVTIGRPNYLARKFIKQAKRAGEPFPIKKVQLTFLRVSK